MLDRKHRLRVGEQGIVGNVTLIGKPRIAMDVGADSVFLINPDFQIHILKWLSPKKWEALLALWMCKSMETAAFTEDDIQCLICLQPGEPCHRNARLSMRRAVR